MWQIESKIRYIQAQIAGNSGAIAKICNADVADLGFKVRIHELIEVPLSAERMAGPLIHKGSALNNGFAMRGPHAHHKMAVAQRFNCQRFAWFHEQRCAGVE